MWYFALHSLQFPLIGWSYHILHTSYFEDFLLLQNLYLHAVMYTSHRWTRLSQWLRNKIFYEMLVKEIYGNDPGNMYFFNANHRKRSEICSTVTIKTPERRQWRSSSVFIAKFEPFLHLFLVFLLLLWTSKCYLERKYCLGMHC